jgi:hypothetical protein
MAGPARISLVSKTIGPAKKNTPIPDFTFFYGYNNDPPPKKKHDVAIFILVGIINHRICVIYDIASLRLDTFCQC